MGERKPKTDKPRCLAAILVLAACGQAAAPAHAADSAPLQPPPEPGPAATDPITDYFLHWFDRANEAQASQPHWMTPITTVTARFEQEFRYDQYQEFTQNGAEINNYFAGKGLELIPTLTNEILINVPGFEQRVPQGTSKVMPATGFLDGNFVTIKQRILSAKRKMAITS
ncbi:MAG TPA: hypothetical protein VEK34_01575 [Methylocella sp.]|nr:hypothetical protein [Methylocella sp.]